MNLLLPTTFTKIPSQTVAPQGAGKASDGFALLMQAIVKGPAALLSVASEGQPQINRNSAEQLLASLSGSGEDEPTPAIAQSTEGGDELSVYNDGLGLVDPSTVIGVPATVPPASGDGPSLVRSGTVQSAVPQPPTVRENGRGILTAGSESTAGVKMVADQPVPATATDKGLPQVQNSGPAPPPVKAIASNGGQSVFPLAPSPSRKTSPPPKAIPVQSTALPSVDQPTGILTPTTKDVSAQTMDGKPLQVPGVEVTDRNVPKTLAAGIRQAPVQADKSIQTIPIKAEMPPVPTAPTGPSPAQQGGADSPVKTAQTVAVTATAAVVPEVRLDVADADPRRTILKSRFAQIKTESAAPSPAVLSKASVAPMAAPTEQETLSLADQTRPEAVKVSDAARPNFLTDQPGTKLVAPVAIPVNENLQDVAAARPVDTLPPQRPETPAVAFASRAENTGPKVGPKPFADALISQIKSVDVSQNRTVVHLHPRGLGTIEVEVIGEKDLASKVVVRVENPAVLQALRDERQLLAQTIGVADSSVFEFRDNETGAQPEGGQDQGAQSDGVFDISGKDEPQRQHRDIVDHGQLDILT